MDIHSISAFVENGTKFEPTHVPGGIRLGKIAVFFTENEEGLQKLQELKAVVDQAIVDFPVKMEVTK